jgi:acetolactate synthase-1/2/3 large subunit
MARLTGGQAVVRSLLAHDVDTVFGVISIHTMDLYDALRDVSDRIRFVGCRHESAASYMAYGYAQVTGKPGVVLSSTGPGAGNTIGALGEAYAASVPIVHITTDVSPELRNSRRGEIHEPNHQLDMFRSVTAWNTFVPRTSGIPHAIFEAFEHLRTRRPRPVDVEIATTALAETDDVEVLGPRGNPRSHEPVVPAPGETRRAAELLASAKRPVILAGGGVISSGATAELIAVAERLGAPIATTYGGKGAVADDHPLAVGCARGGRVYGHNPVFDLLAESDCVLVAGSRLSYTITAAVGMKLPANLIHLDIDPDVFDKNYPASVKLHGDARVGLEALDAALGSLGVTGRTGLRSEVQAVRARSRKALEETGPGAQRATDAIRAAIPRDAVVSVDATIPAYWMVRGFPVFGPRQYLSPHAWSSIGMAFPAGVGARVGQPDRPVVVIHGDGGFQFNLQELGTCAQYGIAVTIVVFNDRAWGILKANQKNLRQGKYFATDLVNPDFVTLASAYGVRGRRVDRLADLQEEIADSTARQDLRLIEVAIPDGFERLS